jgi:large subunit ribosomal protein L25
LPKGVESVELSKGEDHDLAVVTVKAAKGPSAAEAEEDAAAEGEAGATEE